MDTVAVVCFLTLMGGLPAFLLSLAVIAAARHLSERADRYFAAGKNARNFILCLTVAGALAGIIILPRFSRADNYPPSMRCQSNLHQLDLALQAHCDWSEYTYPTSLAELAAVDGVQPKLFVCPGSKNQPGSMSNVMEWTDYVYFSGVGAAAPGSVPVLICPPMFHSQRKPYAGNALMGDHSCTWYPDGAYLDKLIEDPLAFCSNAPASLRSNIYVHVSKRITEQSKGKYKSHGLK